ncbi:MAG: cation:proton antiporter [Deltaproteobacteria bacterium]|nr:cation:proton antiporter [Deltaproteobacteria bacterium]MBW2078964.1 cation:proton antiporter [Deltaproteobacteria bacterium]
MNETARTLITLGILLLLGLATDVIGRRTRLPRVTLLLIFGFAIGPAGLGFLCTTEEKWFSIVADMALIMIGFLLGEKFTLSSLREHGKLVLWFSVAEVVVTALVVLIGLLLIGLQMGIALLLAGIATATDPAATTDVVHETKADGVFTRTMLGIVAVDDAWGLIVFSLMLTAAQAFIGQGGSIAPLFTGAWEIGGALLIGIGLGIPMAYLTGRIKPGEPTLVEALGVVFLCGGIATWLKVSFLLASMVLGCVVANLARHHIRPFHAIEGIEWPFMILFFVLAGASLHTEMLYKIGLVGSAYIILRIIGRLVGAWTGGAISHADPLMRRWMGMALMPQAGVALGMALVAIERRPDLSEIILPVVIASTVLFELIGPVLTRTGLIHVGEVRPDL